MDKGQYSAYLQSGRWRRKRTRRLKKDQCCQTCGVTRGLEVHHRTYERVGRERLSDLITLCNACHVAITASIRARQIDQNWPAGLARKINDFLNFLQ